MGIPDSSLSDLIEKVRCWISWGPNSSVCLSEEFVLPNNSYKMCCECDTSFAKMSLRYLCQSCNQSSCGKCIRGYESYVVQSDGMKVDNEAVKRTKLCKFCSDTNLRLEGGRRHSEKVHPSVSPRYSPEPPSPSYDGADKSPMKTESLPDDRLSRYLESQDCGYSPYAASHRILSSFNAHPFPISVRHSPNWSDEDDAEDSGRHFFSPSSDYFRDSSDIESSSVSTRNEFFSSHFGESSPSDSPSRNDYTFSKADYVVQTIDPGQRVNLLSQEAETILNRSERLTEGQDNKQACSGDLPTIQNQDGKVERPLDFENNGLIWFPPPPDDESDELENNFFSYNDEDDNIGDSGAMFSRSSSLSNMFPAKQNLHEENKEPLKAMVQGHFRALVAQLLQGEDIKSGGDCVDVWLDVITTIAWQAANFVRPDTSRGGSMDPGDYVKVKCVASGHPHESTLIKGVVCTKNIKHKRMTSQFKNPRLLLLGGSLEYHQVANQLASFNTLLHQENDHLKTIISKIESLRPNVLVVEKSVSSCAQDYLLAKEISLVLNVKRPLLERIARCTGASLTPSIEHISTARLGHCELFRLERVTEEHMDANQNRKLSKTLMFFEGCPKRLGCTVLLKGMCREELKKVKHVVQYAVFAAYHLSLETSFLVDEGASLPKMPTRSISVDDNSSSENPNASEASNCLVDVSPGENFSALNSELEESKAYSMDSHLGNSSFLLSTGFEDSSIVDTLPDIFNDDLPSYIDLKPSLNPCEELKDGITVPFAVRSLSESELPETLKWKKGRSGGIPELRKSESFDENDLSSEYFSAADTHQSILVSFSSHCVLKGTVCERSRLLRIKFYGRFDKPLGRYLRDDLFDQTSSCQSCKESAEAHVLCYTHQQGNLTINVRRLPSIKLPGEEDGKIWMWHRCLKCAQIDGVPPATPRVVMSDAAWGLSFGKFLELSFSNHATANRVATCGHSLQRDCLRFYGYGSMVAFFRYSTIDILSVNLPPSVLEFNSHVQQEWISNEASEIIGKMESLYAEISDVVDRMEQKSKLPMQESSDSSDVQSHIMQLKELLQKERSDYIGLLQPFMMKPSLMGMISVDILELNRLRRSLLMHTHYWDHRLYSLDSLLKKILNSKTDVSSSIMRDLKSDSAHSDGKPESGHNENIHESSSVHEFAENDDIHSDQKEESTAYERSTSTSHQACREETYTDGELTTSMAFESIPSYESTLSERIDCAWSGTEQSMKKHPTVSALQAEEPHDGAVKQMSLNDNPQMRRVLMSPVRVHSFDSAIRMQERIRKGLYPSTFQLSTIRSFHASADYSTMLRDPVSNLTRAHSQVLPLEAQKSNLLLSSTPSYISASHVPEGVRLLLPQTGNNDIVIAVYDNEPTSIIAYALNSREYDDWVADKFSVNEGGRSVPRINIEDSRPSPLSAWQSFGGLDLDYIHYGNYGSEDSSTMRTLFSDPKKSPHLRLSFVDESSISGGKVKFSVTCYFAKQFDLLRKKCCPKGVDFVRSLSRCCRWSAQGGKSNVYFAKSLDERFIIKQVTRTELDSFEEFAPEYFKYLSQALTYGSPTCLAKILGIYQVTVKHLKGGKEMKMDLMVMENLFFMRNISKVYDLKGSSRSRYNPDTSGANKVLLDLNLLEALRTKPIFLGSKAKRILERAIWNDTSFLASIDVMDYSLLVGVDEERKELVLGIIDFMRQYTWDKQLETWVKASGILGGPKNASPTIISPKQYKKRFRKAMTAYFLTVPDQWSS